MPRGDNLSCHDDFSSPFSGMLRPDDTTYRLLYSFNDNVIARAGVGHVRCEEIHVRSHPSPSEREQVTWNIRL